MNPSDEIFKEGNLKNGKSKGNQKSWSRRGFLQTVGATTPNPTTPRKIDPNKLPTVTHVSLLESISTSSLTKAPPLHHANCPPSTKSNTPFT